MTTAPVTPQDAVDAAMNATERPQERTYFGQVVMVDCWFAVLEKGAGKRPFDPTRDPETDRRTAIKLQIAYTSKDGTEYTVDQECMDFETSWLKHTLPSLRQLNISLRDLKNKYVQVKRVPTGEKYTNKQNQVKEKTAIEFVATYPDQATMQAAADTFYKSGSKTSGNGNSTGKVEEADLPSNLPGAISGNAEQDFALKSLPALWTASGHNPDKFKALIDQNPLISKHYPSTHPHVLALIGGTVTETQTTDDIPF